MLHREIEREEGPSQQFSDCGQKNYFNVAQNSNKIPTFCLLRDKANKLIMFELDEVFAT